MIFENSEKAVAIKNFQYLWKTEDRDWMANRKKSWIFLARGEFNDCSASELKIYKDYYLSGERNKYIHPVDLFLMTPFESSSQANSFFYSPAFSDRKRLLSELLLVFGNSTLGPDILRPHVIFFSEGVLGREYKPIEFGVGRNKENISPDAASWAGNYFFQTKTFFQDREKEYAPVVDLLDYFVSALKYADDPYHRRQKDMDILLQILHSDIAASDPRPLAQEFLANLKSREKEIVENWNIHAKVDE